MNPSFFNFGARYGACPAESGNSDVSIWLSVDPMADHRSWFSPYNYCQLNPLGRVDPSGALDDWFENELTGDVYYNSEYRKGDEGTGCMQGEGWKWMGKNDMFGKSDNNVINDNKNLATSNNFCGIYNTSGAIPDGYGHETMFSGDNAKEFMGNMGYEKALKQATIYSQSFIDREWTPGGSRSSNVMTSHIIIPEKYAYVKQNLVSSFKLYKGQAISNSYLNITESVGRYSYAYSAPKYNPMNTSCYKFLSSDFSHDKPPTIINGWSSYTFNNSLINDFVKKYGTK